MTQRKSFTKKERARLFSLYEGRCYLCTGAIDGTKEAYEIEHVIPWALTQDDSDENLRLAHVKCHKVKTHGDERAMLNKVERMRMKHLGHHPKSKNPIRSRPFANARTLVEGETLATRPWTPIATPPAVGLRVEVAHADDRYGLYETRGKIFGPITGEFTGTDWECSEGFIVANGRLFVWTPTHWREARP